MTKSGSFNQPWFCTVRRSARAHLELDEDLEERLVDGEDILERSVINVWDYSSWIAAVRLCRLHGPICKHVFDFANINKKVYNQKYIQKHVTQSTV